jgi:parvulin-like peptidyl-prolyl isomerase
MDPEVEKVAFDLEKGKLSDVIKTKGGYEIIKVLERSDKREITFDEARKNIRYELFWKKNKELIDKYYKDAKVDKSPSKKDVLFKIGDEAFKEELIAAVLAKATEKEKEKVRQRWIDYLIETTVFSREARKAGLEKDAEVANEIKRRTDEILTDSFIKKFIEGKIQVSDKEIEDYYKSHQEEFSSPLPVKVKVKTILVKTKEEAENISKKLKAGDSFDNLVREKSIDPSASRGGDIGWIGKGERDPEVEKAAFSLDKDGVSGVIETANGYQIIKVIDKRGGGVSTLPEVEKKIKMKLQAQKMQDEKQRYYEKAGVKIIKENVK